MIFYIQKDVKMEEIESYTLKEIAKKEHKNPRTIKSSNRYIAIRVRTERTERRCELWYQKKPYMIKRIKLEDIQKLYKWTIDFNYN